MLVMMMKTLRESEREGEREREGGRVCVCDRSGSVYSIALCLCAVYSKNREGGGARESLLQVTTVRIECKVSTRVSTVEFVLALFSLRRDLEM